MLADSLESAYPLHIKAVIALLVIAIVLVWKFWPPQSTP